MHVGSRMVARPDNMVDLHLFDVGVSSIETVCQRRWSSAPSRTIVDSRYRRERDRRCAFLIV